MHLGCTPPHRKAAQRQIAEQAVATYGLPREIAPHDALLEEIDRTAGAVTWIAGIIRQMDPDSVVWGRSKVTVGRERSAEARAGISIWVQLYQRERRHLVEVSRTAIAAGIAERQVRLAEDHGRLIAEVIRGVLEDLGVADRPEVPEIVQRRLFAIEGGVA